VDFTTLAVDDVDKQRAEMRVAELSLRLNDAEAATDWARRATSNERPTADMFEVLATAELGLRHTAEARDAVERGLQLDPRHPALLKLRRQLR